MPKKEEFKLGGACYVRLGSIVELGRLSCALERAPFPLFAFREGSAVRIAAQADLFMGTPIFYYVDVEKSGEFLAYRSSGDGEDVQLVPSANNPSYLYAPVIRVNHMPPRLTPSPGNGSSEKTSSETRRKEKVAETQDGHGDRYMSVEVQDLPSLVKVAAYKMVFEEPPLPLFAFRRGESWVIGTFARIDDYEEASIFFYTKSKEEPSAGFVKYAPDKISETALVRKTDEHGFYYIKLVKLSEQHPLVEF